MLAGQKVLLTGASVQLGRALARALGRALAQQRLRRERLEHGAHPLAVAVRLA